MKHLTLVAALVGLVMTSLTVAQDEPYVPFYGNEKCPVSGEKVKRDIYVSVKGQRIYTCCKKCKKVIKKDKTGYLAKTYAEVKDHRNATCPLTGRKVKDGETVTFQGHKVHFCCKKCAKAFMKEPNKQLTLMLHPGLRKVGNVKCPVMEEDDAEPDTFIVYKKRIINLCCDSCYEDFVKTPDKFLDVATRSKKSAGGGK